MSVVGLELVSSGGARKGAGLSWNQFLRLTAGDVWGVTQGVTLGVTEGVTQGVTEGVTQGVTLGLDCADVVHLSSLKSPVGILNFFL